MKITIEMLPLLNMLLEQDPDLGKAVQIAFERRTRHWSDLLSIPATVRAAAPKGVKAVDGGEIANHVESPLVVMLQKLGSYLADSPKGGRYSPAQVREALGVKAGDETFKRALAQLLAEKKINAEGGGPARRYWGAGK
jgi:hypothetical protein